MSKENINKIDNKNDRPSILAAFRAMFSSDEEKISEDEMREVEAMKAASDKNIKHMENKLVSERRKKLVENLKVVETTPIAKNAEKNKDVKDKEKGEDELVK